MERMYREERKINIKKASADSVAEFANDGKNLIRVGNV
jgi:hypothetical protein